jgi:hypothetical protein
MPVFAHRLVIAPGVSLSLLHTLRSLFGGGSTVQLRRERRVVTRSTKMRKPKKTTKPET